MPEFPRLASLAKPRRPKVELKSDRGQGKSATAATTKTLQDNPDWKVHVEGYTDSTGSKSANEALSRRRAESVANWLAEHGVDRSRLTSKGYGEEYPVADNSTDEGRGKNRRVDIVRM